MDFATAYESVADAVGERTALIQGDSRRTWAELDERASRLAGVLTAAGLEPGAKVASYCYNSNEYVEGLLATFKMRGVPVNVNYRYLEDELVYLLENSDAEALLFHSSLADRVAGVLDRVSALKLLLEIDDSAPGARVRRPPQAGAHRTTAAEKASGGGRAPGSITDARCVPYEDALAANAPMPRIERSGDDLLLLYTGGTTGMPKGVMWRAEDLFGVLAEAYYPLFGEALPETADDAGAAARRMIDSGRVAVHLPASPLMHGTGMFTTFQAMMGGGTIVTLTGRTFDPHELWRAVEQHGVAQMAIVGDAFAKPMLQALRDGAPDGHEYDTTTLGLIISSGVMWTAEVKRELAERVQCLCLDSLGSSEAVGMAASMSGPGSEQVTAKFTVGTKTKVFTDDGREVEPGSGEVGMVAVGGYIPAGYYKDEAKSASTFREVAGRRWSIPGDFATVEADGSITLLGRGSNCINTGGEKVYPEEVEEAVKLHPQVVDCLVVGVPDERFGEAIAAVVTVDAGTSVAPSDISAALGALSRYKHPRRWVFIDEILRAPNGKADYKAAKAKALAD